MTQFLLFYSNVFTLISFWWDSNWNRSSWDHHRTEDVLPHILIIRNQLQQDLNDAEMKTFEYNDKNCLSCAIQALWFMKLAREVFLLLKQAILHLSVCLSVFILITDPVLTFLFLSIWKFPFRHWSVKWLCLPNGRLKLIK